MIDWMQAVQDIYWYFSTISFLMGAAIGSFLNVVIYRLPTEGMSIVKPRSFCPQCKTPIAAYDNIPLFSFLLLGAKCRHCKTKISARYFSIELLTGMFGLYYFHMAFGAERVLPHVALIFFVYTCAMIVISFIDIDLKIIPNRISLPGIPIGLACSFVMPQGFLNSLIGVGIGAGTLLVVAYGYYFITKVEGMGFGDIKLMGMIGAFLGWKAVLFTLIAGSSIGLVYGLIFVVFPGKGRYHQIPFGPFLATGSVLYILFGPQLIRFYLSLMMGG